MNPQSWKAVCYAMTHSNKTGSTYSSTQNYFVLILIRFIKNHYENQNDSCIFGAHLRTFFFLPATSLCILFAACCNKG